LCRAARADNARGKYSAVRLMLCAGEKLPPHAEDVVGHLHRAHRLAVADQHALHAPATDT